jgi:hypothetical protein
MYFLLVLMDVRSTRITIGSIGSLIIRLPMSQSVEAVEKVASRFLGEM